MRDIGSEPGRAFREVITTLQALGVELIALHGSIGDGRGSSDEAWFLERRVEGQTFQIAIFPYADDEVLEFSVVRSICAGLRIDTRHFGVYLADQPAPIASAMEALDEDSVH